MIRERRPYHLPVFSREKVAAAFQRNRPAKLSITHNFSQHEAEVDVGEAREFAPEDGVSRRAVVLAGEIAAEFGDGEEVMGQVLRSRPLWIAYQMVEDVSIGAQNQPAIGG